MKLKVLISAYACEPHRGSEPGVAWNLVKELAKYNEVHVVTRKNNRNKILESLRSSSCPDLFFHYYDLPLDLINLKNKYSIFLYLYYFFWQIGAYRLARRLIIEDSFHIVHHLTFGNMWMPTFLGFLNVPLILGPLGGGETIPKVMRGDFGPTGKIKEIFRDLIVSTIRFNPLFIYNCQQAKSIILKTSESTEKVLNAFRGKCCVITDVGVHEEIVSPIDGIASSFYILNVGTFEDWRGQALLLRGFSLAVKEESALKLVIIGYGKSEKGLRKICRDERIEDSVSFVGKVSLDDYMNYLKGAAIVANPCLKEGGVTFFFDALALGKPIVNLDVSGCARLNKDIGGYCIKITSLPQVHKDIGQAIICLYRDPLLRKRLSLSASQIAKESCTWQSKGRVFDRIYRNALTGLNENPARS